ncbi:hypothetical protein [Cecembia calidifontis]|jgi:hypothetical protein|uniref:Histidine kinase N-terminal 7TM region domain-containing protein n=1 Tax=Cecembia calidifontis TaxID=1187080 RepID=A0A4Q7P6J2_9BACT|nr:hypothetical protein [Cecembia calidifontis]RZS95595.1 hypothetical protein BC751_1129 [Cecembia calidifontis]
MFGNFYLLIIATGFLFSLFVKRKNQGIESTAQQTIIAILFLALLMEGLGVYLAAKGINNSLLYNVGWVYGESLLLIFYLSLLEVNQVFKRKIAWISVGLVVWGLVNTLFFQSITTEFQYFTFLPFTVFIIFLVVRFLFHLMQMKAYADRDLIRLPHFWISWAILLFYVEAILLFGIYQFHPVFVLDHVQLLFTINQFVAGLMYLVFGLAFILPWFNTKKLALID